MGICPGDSETDGLTNLRFADDVLLFSTSLEQLQRMMCDFKRHTESGIEDPPGKYENCQQSKFEQKKRSGDQQHQSRCIAGERVCQVSRTNNQISATGNNRNQESNSSCLGVVPQVQPGVDIKILPPAAQAPLVQHGDLSDAELCFWNMDPDKRTREDDTMD